jgi:Putative DNA-binding domain
MEAALNDQHAKFGLGKAKASFDYNKLKLLVKGGENGHVEFKLKANHPEKIVKEVVAFANTEGGNLLIGIDDDQQIKGLKFAEEEELELIKAIEKFCEPAIEYSIKSTILPNQREVLIFEIQKSKSKPHFVKLNTHTGEKVAYVRVKDKSLQASKEVIKYLKGQSKFENITFTFGDKESKLMQYLASNNSITVKDYSKIAKIPIWLASKTLVLLALASVLKIIPGEISDQFIVHHS